MAEEEKKDPITMVEEGEETVGAPGEEGSAPAAVVVDGATSAGGGAGDRPRLAPPPPPPPPPPTATATIPAPDEGRIALATSFLRRAGVSPRGASSRDEGRRYLESKADEVGLTKAEIDEAMDRMVGGGGRGGGGGGDGGERLRNGEAEEDDEDFRRGRGSSSSSGGDRRSPRRPEDGGDDDGGGGRAEAGRPRPRADRHPRDARHHRDDYGHVPKHYDGGDYDEGGDDGITGMRRPRRPHHSAGGGEERRSPSSPTASHAPSLAGGFTLGVLSLAALRWLNGGDFVLFPPPGAAGGVYATTTTASIAARTLPSKSQQEEDGGGEDDEGEDDGDEGEDESTAEDDEDDGDEEEEEEDEEEEAMEGEDEVDDALQMILNGKDAADPIGDSSRIRPRRRPPSSSSPSPSYGELVTEIRSLASAIRSDADSRDRAARAARNAAAGRVVTDDAMDFLKRQKMKKKKEEEGNENEDKEEEGGGGVGGGGMKEGAGGGGSGEAETGCGVVGIGIVGGNADRGGGGGTTGQTRDSPSSPRCSWRCRAICWRSGIASSRPGDARKSGRRGAATEVGGAEAEATTSRDRHRPGTVVQSRGRMILRGGDARTKTTTAAAAAAAWGREGRSSGSIWSLRRSRGRWPPSSERLRRTL